MPGDIRDLDQVGAALHGASHEAGAEAVPLVACASKLKCLFTHARVALRHLTLLRLRAWPDCHCSCNRKRSDTVRSSFFIIISYRGCGTFFSSEGCSRRHSG